MEKRVSGWDVLMKGQSQKAERLGKLSHFTQGPSCARRAALGRRAPWPTRQGQGHHERAGSSGRYVRTYLGV